MEYTGHELNLYKRGNMIMHTATVSSGATWFYWRLRGVITMVAPQRNYELKTNCDYSSNFVLFGSII
jgi:hypothetical protein